MKPVPRIVCCLLSILLVNCRHPESTLAAPQSGPKEADTDAAQSSMDEFRIEGTLLQVLREKDACVLKSGTSTLALRPKAPCFFLRRDGKVQTYAYKDAAVEWMVIVAGTSVSDANRKVWNLSAQDVCGEQSEAVMQKAGRLRVSRSIHAGGVYCRDKGVDEKEFWSFAHDPE